MYYDMNPAKRINEHIDNIYENLLDWINTHKGCTVQDIKIHLELTIEERKRFKQ